MASSNLPLLGSPGTWEELEQSYASLQTWLGSLSSSVAALAGNLALTPVGGFMAYGGATAPAGWLLCNGAAVSRATYAALFLIIGTTYGVGDGATTFTLPDFRQRFILGKAASGTGVTLGSTGGTIDHTHTISGSTATGTSGAGGDHSHGGTTGSEASHTHTFSATTGNNSASATANEKNPADSVATLAAHTHTHSVSGTTDAGSSHNHTITTSGTHTHTVPALGVGTLANGTANPPYQTANFIVYAGV